MAKHSGKHARKNFIKRKNAKGKKSKGKSGVNNETLAEVFDISREELDEISILAASSHRYNVKKKKLKKQNFLSSHEAKDKIVSKSETPKPRFSKNKSGKATGILNIVIGFFARTKSGNASALEFASKEKRAGKKGRRRRRIAFSVGFGILIITIVFMAALIPWMGVGTEDAPPAEVLAYVAATSTENAAALANTQKSFYASYEFDISDIPTTPPDVTQESALEPTTMPTKTPESVVKTKDAENPIPIPTTKPDPTPIPIDMDDLVADFLVEADLYYNDVGYSSNHYEYTENELYVLAQLIHGEARGESYEGMVAVGNVVMNRVLARGYPGNDIIEVITAKSQFSGYSSSIKPSSACKSAARAVLDYEVWVIPQNIYFFNSHKPIGEDWGRHVFYTRIDGHNFYTESYSGRSNIAAVPPELFERTYKWPQYGCKPETRVYRIQYMLNELGYDVVSDKYFGMGSVDAIKEFQSKYGLETDGIAGPSTIEKLIREYGIEDYYLEFG